MTYKPKFKIGDLVTFVDDRARKMICWGVVIEIDGAPAGRNTLYTVYWGDDKQILSHFDAHLEKLV